MIYLALGRPIVITSSNRRLRLTEGASTFSADLAAGTYWLKGDGASDDLCKALKDALDNASAGGNAYSVTLTLSPVSLPSAVVTVTRTTGSATFALLWADGSTTLPAIVFGFASANTANNSNAKAGALSPSSLWYSGEAVSEDEPGASAETFVDRALSGFVSAGRVSEHFAEWRLRPRLVPLVRLRRAQAITAGHEWAAYESFWRMTNSGARLAVGFSSDGVVAPTWSGDRWVMHKETADGGTTLAQRVSPAVPFFSWPIRLHRWVAP
jgi:hypothetical protein